MNKGITFLFLLMSTVLIAQVGIGTDSPDPTSQLEVKATNKGILIPRVSLVDVTNTTLPISSPTESLLVYNDNADVTGGDGKGFYFFNGTRWEKMISNPKNVSSVSMFNGDSSITIKDANNSIDIPFIEAGFEPSIYNSKGNIEVKLVIRYYYNSNVNTTNFQLRAHDGNLESYPIVVGDAWTYATTQDGGVATSPWKSWDAGTNALEIHLNGNVVGTNAEVYIQNVYLLVRSQ